MKKAKSILLTDLRRSRYLRQGVKGKQSEMADADFEYVLDDAELQFGWQPTNVLGRGSMSVTDGGACSRYETICNVTGREVFWRAPQSKPTKAVSCVKVSLRRAQKHPMIIRSIRARSSHGRRASAVAALPSTATTMRRTKPTTASTTKLPVATLPPAVLAAAASAVASQGAIYGPGRPLPSIVAVRSPADAEAAAKALALQMARWKDRHTTWTLTVCVAFTSGAVAGVVGIVVARLQLAASLGRSSRRSRSKVAQS
ncbi:unnamed protein product [Polarella glacialis]|uniref:Uncharacterized protein n=1 Tax=Polarella glacialis TaxID=89957 RepID=A0A813JA93_POLGL|nr:unnamed protein product [Polarella glacialis]